MSAIIDDQFVIAVDFEVLEPNHKLFENRFGLESDNTVHVAFIVRYNHSAIYRLRDVGQKIVLLAFGAQFFNGDWKKEVKLSLKSICRL